MGVRFEGVELGGGVRVGADEEGFCGGRVWNDFRKREGSLVSGGKDLVWRVYQIRWNWEE
ncbi:GDP-mannose pyrophosphorylase [Sesbania bispinosa]|nr:GDP-mannose pyrophosphorylase [Sesbania bispinosa]